MVEGREGENIGTLTVKFRVFDMSWSKTWKEKHTILEGYLKIEKSYLHKLDTVTAGWAECQCPEFTTAFVPVW
jgi:hypothetical protein